MAGLAFNDNTELDLPSMIYQEQNPPLTTEIDEPGTSTPSLALQEQQSSTASFSSQPESTTFPSTLPGALHSPPKLSVNLHTSPATTLSTSPAAEPTALPSLPVFSSKVSRLETMINRIVSNTDYSHKFNGCVIEHLKKQLKDHRRQAIIYMLDCFGEMIEDKNFAKWVAKSISYKSYNLKNLLIPMTPKIRKSNAINRQDIYNFGVENLIVSKNSASSAKVIPKMTFLKKNKDISNPEIHQEEKTGPCPTIFGDTVF